MRALFTLHLFMFATARTFNITCALQFIAVMRALCRDLCRLIGGTGRQCQDHSHGHKRSSHLKVSVRKCLSNVIMWEQHVFGRLFNCVMYVGDERSEVSLNIREFYACVSQGRRCRLKNNRKAATQTISVRWWWKTMRGSMIYHG